MQEKYDAIWYLPQNKSKVLPLLNIPSQEERRARGIIGVRWGPGQPKPGIGSGPNSGWNMVWGNFLGYERDPDKLRALLDLKEISHGLIGGIFKPDALDTDRHRDLVAEDRSNEETKRPADTDFESKRALYEQQADDAAIEFLYSVALVSGIKKPSKLSIEQLKSIFKLAQVTRDDIDEESFSEYVRKTCGSPPIEEKQPPLVMLEDLDDWDNPLQVAYASTGAPTKFIRKP